MAAHQRQILVVVDLYPGVAIEDLVGQLPDAREDRFVLRLSDFGASSLAPPPDTKPVDWTAIGTAVERLVARLHELQESSPVPSTVHVAGKGPLSVFVHLGYRTTKSVPRVIVLNPPPGGGNWESFPIAADADGGPNLLDDIRGLPAEPEVASGRLAIAIDTAGRRTPKKVYSDFLGEKGSPVAGVMQFFSSGAVRVTPENTGSLVRQLAQLLSVAPTLYPERSGLAIFIGGPAQVAFAVGRAMSPNVVGGDVWLTEHRGGKFELVYSLPFAVEASPAVPGDAESVLARRKVLDELMAGIAELKRELKPEHLPTAILPEKERRAFMERLYELEPSAKTNEQEPFEMRVLEGRYTIANGGILQAFVRSTQEQQRAFAKLLLLHELIHDRQALRSTNYMSIGRACFVLEQIDYAADVFSLHTLMNLELEQGGPRAQKEVSKRLRGWMEMILHGIQAFDLMEQGSRMGRLPERRLRRYLLWHLQLARAATVREASHLEQLLAPSLVVELAPLAGYVDAHRYDKVVTRALTETELFIGIGGRLVRASKRPGLDPGELVEMVRGYAHEPIQGFMVKVVDDHREELAPWRVAGS